MVLVGDTVRVWGVGGREGACARATVACLNPDCTVDVLYEEPEWAGREEEPGVDEMRVAPLFEWEVGAGMEDPTEDALLLKEHGNHLFRSGDVGAALSKYTSALFHLVLPLRVGKPVSQ